MRRNGDSLELPTLPESHAQRLARRRKRLRDKERPSAAKRLYGYRWQKASKLYLRSHPLCVDPHGEHRGRPVVATVVDHIVPHRGDLALFWDSDNWQSLCKPCHDRKTAREVWANG